jgi:hypothetical protein
MAKKKRIPRRSIWRISLRQEGEAAGRYVQTQRLHRVPAVGETISVRVDGQKLLVLVESMEVQKSPRSGVTVFALEVVELDRIRDETV